MGKAIAAATSNKGGKKKDANLEMGTQVIAAAVMKKIQVASEGVIEK